MPGRPAAFELTESLAELTQSVDVLATMAGLPDSGASATPGETPGLCLQALLAAPDFTEACMEIIRALTEDAHDLLKESVSLLRLGGDGPDSLPTLVRSLVSRMETTE
nr:hypothetical protein KitaXyl93_00880 [Kitasatospora sp. Xyl93]